MRRGILLAILSRNDERLVASIWERLYGGRLRMDDFAIRKINWRPKAENFEEILKQTNLLPRNTVYIDDNPVERAGIKAAFPDVRTFGPNPLVWRRVLLWSAETQVASITAESAARTEMMKAQVVREERRRQMSREDFLASLGVEMHIREVDGVEHPDFARTFELVNKSNQFNTTGKRWTGQEFRAAFAAGTRVFIFEVKDKFTSYGIVGIIVVHGVNISQFVMSCRVVGLEVEIAAIAHVLASIGGAADAAEVTADLAETELNLLARDLWRRCGFRSNGAGRWLRSSTERLAPPPHITIAATARAGELENA
jgi:FkbH-like protein